MRFSTSRGRPRKEKIEKDNGTTELQAKRLANLTTEPLDLAFSRGLITEEQRDAGVRLRWLYTLKLGAPTISAYAIGEGHGRACRAEDYNWESRKQAEFNLAIQLLDKTKSRRIVMDTCVLCQMPSFLYYKPNHLKNHNLRAHLELKLLVEGLEAISNIRKYKNKLDKNKTHRAN